MMTNYNESIQLTADPTTRFDGVEKLGLAIFGCGLLAFLLAMFGGASAQPLLFSLAGFGLTAAGALTFIVRRYAKGEPGVRNNGVMFSPATTRSALNWMLAVVLTGFYIVLYWYPELLERLIRIMDPASSLLRGNRADQWFLYSALYTVAVLVMGVRAILKYRHSRHQIIRTLSVIFFQFVFGLMIPALLQLLNEPEFYFTYFWPLKYSYLFPRDIHDLISHPGRLGVFMVVWGAIMTFIATPTLTYFYGKRWYCSWVCGCGGLAETAGDPYRQLSDKSLRAWKIERWMIHSVLLFITVTTLLLWINAATRGAIFGEFSGTLARVYGFYIGAVFSGVIGVGFYPLMGARVWCRFGCPMAAVLGIFQKYFSRFRITVNGGQCISCGNCSTYCEMGIDVRWYAQRGQNVIRASCVGCGICSTVCPRGVLNLENGPREGRYNEPMLIGVEQFNIIGQGMQWDAEDRFGSVVNNGVEKRMDKKA
jgi:polyferredoxin